VGARLKVAEGPWRGEPRIDIRSDGRGEYFDLRFAGGQGVVELDVIDVRPRDRHLLLLARIGEDKSKFLCGHDERHWFVAAIPEAARGVTGVVAAKVALQPPAVRDLIERRRPKDPFRRRNAAYLRQGEWFFVPAVGIHPQAALVLRDEPLRRGRGNPHVMQFAYRRGGEVVYVSRLYPTGLSQARFERLPERERKNQSWQQFLRDPEVYAKGAVRHPDHTTIRLAGWHRVLMNTEQGARAMRHVAFID
jgi:hypothetical protein